MPDEIYEYTGGTLAAAFGSLARQSQDNIIDNDIIHMDSYSSLIEKHTKLPPEWLQYVI